MGRYIPWIVVLIVFFTYGKTVHANDEGNNVIGTIQTLNTYTVYESPSIESNILVLGTSNTQLSVLGIEQGFYKVNLEGIQGFIKIEEASPNFTGEIKQFQVTAPSVPVFERKNGKLIQVSSFSEGSIWPRMQSSAGYHVASLDGKTLYIPIQGTFFTSQPAPSEKPPKSQYPIVLISEEEVPVYLSNEKALGTVRKGQRVTIIGMQDGKAIINYFGLIGLVELSKFIHIDYLNPKKNLSLDEVSYLMNLTAALYPEFTKLQQIGKSVEGRPIYAIRLGNGKKEVLFDASMHAREHMTTNVLMEMLDAYSANYVRNTIYGGYNVKKTLDQVSIWFVPMLNPDGVTLVQNGAKSLKNSDYLLRINGGSTNFFRWKANGRGVDLNENFEAQWSQIKSIIKKPSYQKYKGPKVFSEPESIALRNFINSHDFKAYLSYHSSGQVLYWFQYQKGIQAARDLKFAKQISKITGYKVINPLYIKGSGASTDWFIDTKKMPALTVEISPFSGEKPVPLKNWDKVWQQNHKVGLFTASQAISF